MNQSQANQIWLYLQERIRGMNNGWHSLSVDTIVINQTKVKTCQEIQREMERLFPDEKFGET